MDISNRWDNVTIPAGATITSAILTVRIHWATNDGTGTKTNIYFEDADDPAAPTTAGDASGRVRTTAFTAWDDVNTVQGTDEVSPDFTAVLQEVVDRPGWASGQALQMLWDDDGSTCSGAGKHYCIDSYDWSSATAPLLEVGYTA